MASWLSKYHTGSWGTPDFGLTEWIQKTFTPKTAYASSGGSNLLRDQNNTYSSTPINWNAQQSYPAGTASKYQAPKPTVLGGSTGGNTPNYNVPSSAPTDYINQVNQQVDEYGAMIDRDYENAMSLFSAQESGLRSQAETAGKQIENEYTGALGEIESSQASGIQGVQTTLQTGEKEATSAFQQARDLFRETQQANIAQLSGLGISSSSVAEALAERLGVETARRIASVTGSLSDLRVNAQKEIARITDYYNVKKNTIKEQKGIEISKINQALLAGVNQINAARFQSQADKASRRYELLSNAQAAINQIRQQVLEYENSLKNWAVQKQEALKQVITDPNYLASVTQNLNVANQQFAPSGFTYVPTIGKYGQITGYTLKKKDEDEMGNDLTNPNYW